MDKEIRFSEKKVDESWKQDVDRERKHGKPLPEERTVVTFSHFITSLGYQTLMHLGEIPSPDSQEKHLDLEAAKETIDLLILLESKSQGNQTPDEAKLFKNLIPELQMKFVQKTSGRK